MSKFRIICKRTEETIHVVEANNKDEAIVMGAATKRLTIDQFLELYDALDYEAKKENRGEQL